jgi:hypothetical protein
VLSLESFLGVAHVKIVRGCPARPGCPGWGNGVEDFGYGPCRWDRNHGQRRWPSSAVTLEERSWSGPAVALEERCWSGPAVALEVARARE